MVDANDHPEILFYRGMAVAAVSADPYWSIVRRSPDGSPKSQIMLRIDANGIRVHVQDPDGDVRADTKVSWEYLRAITEEGLWPWIRDDLHNQPSA